MTDRFQNVAGARSTIVFIHESSIGDILTDNRQGNLCHYPHLLSSQNERGFKFIQVGPGSLRGQPSAESRPELGNTVSSIPHSPDWFQARDIDRQITAHVLNSFNQSSLNVNGVIEVFSETNYSWLPIINISDIKVAARQLQDEPSGGTATLLLLMHSVNRLSSAGVVNDNELITLTCKRFFTVLQLDSKERLQIVQIGIMLSALELNSGLFHDALLTITTCATIAYQLGLHQIQASGVEQQSEPDMIKRNMWYTIVLLDR